MPADEKSALESLWSDPETPEQIALATDAVLRVPLSRADHPGPGVYLLYGLIDSSWQWHWLYSPEEQNSLRCLYVGSSTSAVSDRLSRHRKSLRMADGVDPRRTEVRVIPTCDGARARKLEAVLIDWHRPAWSLALTGLGSNAQGHTRLGHDDRGRPDAGRRGQRTPAWDCVHRGRRNYDPHDIEVAAAITAMIRHRINALRPRR